MKYKYKCFLEKNCKLYLLPVKQYMIQKNLILSGLILAVSLLFIATLNYPGGSIKNELSQGYNWGDNYISNLLHPQAVNGMDNTARPWAVGGVLLMSASFGLFFLKFSQLIKVKSAAFVIKYGGIAATIAAFLTVIPSFHDIMVSISGTCTLLVFFYLTVFILKSKLHFLKLYSVLALLLFYMATYMYYTMSYLDYLPIMQKAIHLVQIVWVLILEYYAKEEDFQHIVK
jgi:hypothetical protein